MKITKIEDRMIASEAKQAQSVPPCVFPCTPCAVCTTCTPCAECTQSQLSQPELSQACGPWGAEFASLGQ